MVSHLLTSIPMHRVAYCAAYVDFLDARIAAFDREIHFYLAYFDTMKAQLKELAKAKGDGAVSEKATTLIAKLADYEVSVGEFYALMQG